MENDVMGNNVSWRCSLWYRVGELDKRLCVLKPARVLRKIVSQTTKKSSIKHCYRKANGYSNVTEAKQMFGKPKRGNKQRNYINLEIFKLGGELQHTVTLFFQRYLFAVVICIILPSTA